MQALKQEFGTTHFKFVERQAGQPVIVFLNSLGSDARIWDDVLANGINQNSHLLMDFRGHGLSDVGDLPTFALSDLAADLKQLLDHLNIKKVVLCGVSIGGLIAQQFYANWPEMVSGMVLSNTADKIGNEAGWQDRIDKVNEDGIGSIADDILTNWFAPAFKKDRPADFALYANMLTRTDPRGYVGACYALQNADLRSKTPNISVPTICIAAEQDQSTPVELVRDFCQRIGHAEFECLKDVGHLPSIEAPTQVAKVIKTLLARIESKNNG